MLNLFNKMARKKKEVEVKETKKTSFSPKVARVVANGVAREYSKEVHGKDFADLAESFARKNNTVVIYG